MNNIHEIEQSLIKNSRELLFGYANPDLKAALLHAMGNITHAYVIDWIPEQASDIYTIIVPPDKRVLIELPRHGVRQELQPIVEISKYDGFTQCSKGMTREIRDKLQAVANLIAQARRKI